MNTEIEELILLLEEKVMVSRYNNGVITPLKSNSNSWYYIIIYKNVIVHYKIRLNSLFNDVYKVVYYQTDYDGNRLGKKIKMKIPIKTDKTA